MIKAISFDGDNTLWDFQKVMARSLERVLEVLKTHLLPDQTISIADMITIRDDVASKLRGKTTNLEEIRLEAFVETLHYCGLQDRGLAKELNSLYLRHRFEDIELYPDVMPVIRELKCRFKIGLISNGNSYPERCGLGDCFDFVVFSQDHQTEKPERKIFDIACMQAGCLAAEILHVGDSLECDIAGAQAASIASVWLNRSRIVNDSIIIPEYEISSLAGLAEVIDQIGGRAEQNARANRAPGTRLDKS